MGGHKQAPRARRAVGRAHTITTVAPCGRIAKAYSSPSFRKRCTPTATANGGQFVSQSFDGMGGNFDCVRAQNPRRTPFPRWRST